MRLNVSSSADVVVPPAQKARQSAFDREESRRWIQKLLDRIPGRDPLADRRAAADANRLDRERPDLKPGAVRPAEPDSIAEMLGRLPVEDAALVKSFSGGLKSEPLYRRIAAKGAAPRDTGRLVERAVRDRLEGRLVDVALLAGIASRLAGLNRGRPLYFFSLRETMTAPLEGFDSELHPFLMDLRSNFPGYAELGDRRYGQRVFEAYRREVERLAAAFNEKNKNRAARHPVLARLRRVLGRPFHYDPGEAVQNQKFIVHVNQETGPDIVRHMAENDFFGFNPRNMVFLFQDVYGTWERGADGSLTPDPEHVRPFGHGQLPYDQVQAGFAFVMERIGGPDGRPRYEQKFLEQDALAYMADRGGRIISVEELGDVNMLVHPLKLDQDVAARLNFNRGFNYTARVADNATGQKGGYGVSAAGRQFIAEGPLIAHDDYDYLGTAKLNFWGIRCLLEPVREALRRSKPFYCLDVREKAAGEKRLALDTFWSNVTLLKGVKTRTVFLPGDVGNTFKKPESIHDVAAACAWADADGKSSASDGGAAGQFS
jgi:hypothetical protein